ncbi:hypothetical protein RHOSPDRAFT_27357 [Rhodotorula sp. JG-1b]|nr:hypothetical protein RHOSPDRAFT_27357 [Rhodotorula sp. JG-1b]
MENASQWQGVLYQIRLDVDSYIDSPAAAAIEGGRMGADEKHREVFNWQVRVREELCEAGKKKQRWVLGELMRYLQDSYRQPAEHGQERRQFGSAYDMLLKDQLKDSTTTHLRQQQPELREKARGSPNNRSRNDGRGCTILNLGTGTPFSLRQRHIYGAHWP